MSLEKGFIEAIKAATKSNTSAYDTLATVTRVQDGTAWVHIDGGVDETPAELTINAKKGDTVRLRVSGGRAYLIGNSTDPPASGFVVSGMGRQVQSVADILHANKITANTGIFEHLIANDARIKNIKAEKLDVDVANMKQATINNLKAGTAQVQGLDAAYANIDGANIGQAFISEVFTKNAMIEGAIVTTLNAAGEIVAVRLNADYINANSIKVDRLILRGQDGLYYTLNTNGETVEQLQTPANSLDGSIITAQSITASKIAVEDLAAFRATIAGMILEDGTIHTVGKTSAMSTVDGFYIGNADGAGSLEDMSGDSILAHNDDDFDTSSDYNDGIAIGNGTDYLRFVGGNLEIKSEMLDASFVKPGTSGVDTLSNAMKYDSNGLSLYQASKRAGASYANIDNDSFDIKKISTDGVINPATDTTLASFGREVTIGSRASGSGVGSYSQVFGAACIASGNYAHAEGNGSEARGSWTHTEGYESVADYVWGDHANPFEPDTEEMWSGMYAHAEGYKTYTSFEGAHAEGGYTQATGAGAHAEGGWSNASGYFSHAQNKETIASGECSHAEGKSTRAEGVGSHAEGKDSEARANFTHAQNLGTVAIGEGQTAIGKYNIASTRYAFIIGGGMSDTNRETIFAIDWQGKIHLPSSIGTGIVYDL